MDYKARVKFDDNEWLVIDAFNYNNKSYMYLIRDIEDEINSMNELKQNEDKINIIFIEKLENGNYVRVNDERKLEELNNEVAIRFLIQTKK